jgi:hypothetical protein
LKKLFEQTKHCKKFSGEHNEHPYEHRAKKLKPLKLKRVKPKNHGLKARQIVGDVQSLQNDGHNSTPPEMVK